MQQTDIIRKDQEKFVKEPNIPNYEEAYKTFSWQEAAHNVDFFADGTFNAAYNAIDRHVEHGKKDKVALHYKGANEEKEQYTFGELKTLSDKFANVLVSQEVVKGDRVFIFLPTIPERYVAFLGILKLGAIAGTMFAAFQEMALLDRLSDSEAKIVITNAALYPRIKNIWKDLPNLEKVILVGRGSDALPTGENIISYDKEMAKVSDTFETAHLQPEDFSYMLYTSGTTGKPKGVVHSHYDILQAMMTTKYVLDVQDDDIYWCTADLGWVTGVVYGCLGPWGLGATQLISESRFNPELWYKLIEEYQVTVWYSAPTVIRMMMGSETDPKDFKLHSLRHLCSVGEPLNPEAIWWALEKFGLPFHDTWWQTEQGGITITNYPCLDIKPGSMGKPFPGVTAAIIDDNGNELGINQEGNLALKSSTVSSLMKRIWNNEEKFQSYFIGEWYLSGDRAYKDDDGYFWFIGRADDVINTSGERVGPFEVESALVEYPDVVEAGVIGKPDALRGEIIKAFVVVKPGIEQTDELKEKIKAFVKKHLAGHAYPREIDFIDKLPKTRSGKIMRRVLKAKEMGMPLGDTSTLEDY
ncbi:MAG TPA: acetate--CoA ligase [Candidatus Saccharimonadales bacterium]|nr:acetate--CoA ligase [Candidatus Saccharimonadales bacterium]